MLYLLRIFLSKKIYIQRSFRKIFGIGLIRSKKIASLLGLHPNSKLKNLFNYKKKKYFQNKLNKFSFYIEKSLFIDYELKRVFSVAVQNLKNIKCYRGFRHTMMLPTRGQRTHTNASTFRKVLLSRRLRKLKKIYGKK